MTGMKLAGVVEREPPPRLRRSAAPVLVLLLTTACASADLISARRDEAERQDLLARAAQVLRQATAFELLALDDDESEALPERLGTFPRIGVRARVPVNEEGERERIAGALDESLRRAGGYFLCFFPKHAIRARGGDGSVEIVICLGCRQIAVSDARGQHRFYAIDPDVLERALSPVFQRAGLRFDRAFGLFGRWTNR